MEVMKLNEVKKGQLLKLNKSSTKTYARGAYSRASKSYQLIGQGVNVANQFEAGGSLVIKL